MIRFIEIINDTNFNSRLERTAVPAFRVGEVWINESHISNLRAAPEYERLLSEGSLPAGVPPTKYFTSITTSNGNVTETHIVVGEVNAVAQRLGYDRRTLLKG